MCSLYSMQFLYIMAHVLHYSRHYLQHTTLFPASCDAFTTQIHEPSCCDNYSPQQSPQALEVTQRSIEICLNYRTIRNISVRRSDQPCPNGFHSFFDSALNHGPLTSKYSVCTSLHIDLEYIVSYYQVVIASFHYKAVWYAYSYVRAIN